MEIKVLKKSFTKNILEKIIEIDKTFYSDFDFNDTSWYFERYNNKNVVYVLDVDGEIVGYFNLISISKKLFDDICKLKYSQDYSFPKSEVNVDSDYFYMPSLLVKEEYRKYSMPLILKLKKVVENSKNFVVIAISKEGKILSEMCLEKLGTKGKATIFTKRQEEK